ncbi:hypothetical protein JAGODDHD_03917 (plasmid) [Sphingomonas paucimobilis]|nr:hypothetical protein [Sphingomonas paucimobilis]
MLKKPFGQVTVTYLVEHIEGIDKQTFMLGRRICDGVDVRSVFGSIAALKA